MRKVGPDTSVGAKPLLQWKIVRVAEVARALSPGPVHARFKRILLDELPVRLHPTALRSGIIGRII